MSTKYVVRFEVAEVIFTEASMGRNSKSSTSLTAHFEDFLSTLFSGSNTSSTERSRFARRHAWISTTRRWLVLEEDQKLAATVDVGISNAVR